MVKISHFDCRDHGVRSLVGEQNSTDCVEQPKQNKKHLKGKKKNKSTNYNYCRVYGENGNLLYCWWECKVHSLCNIVWRFFRKVKVEIPYDPAVPLLGIYPEKIIIKKIHA